MLFHLIHTTMKRLYALGLAILIALASISPIRAQEKGDLRLTYGAGFFSFSDYLGILIVGLGSIDTSDGVSSQSFFPMLNPNIGLEYHFNEDFTLGASLSLGGGSAWTNYDESGDLSKRAIGIYPTLLVSSHTRYLRSKQFSMYGHWGVGATFFYFNQVDKNDNYHQSDMVVYPNADIYPLCFSFGKKAGFNVECGWGTKGFVSVGGYCTFLSK